MTAVVEGWRAAELKTYLASYESVLVRLHIAAGDRQAAGNARAARSRWPTRRAVVTYKAELLRVLAHTHDDPRCPARRALQTAIDLARKQGAVVFELRSAADAFELIGAPAGQRWTEVLSRIPADQDWPELARARALLV